MRVGLKAISLNQNLVGWFEVGGRDLDLLPTVFTDKVLMVLVDGEVPGAGLTTTELNMVHQAESLQLIESSVNG